ncbi:cell division protein FtsQ/DivIB [Wolbachia endosymbiont of Pentidionis agamae]|uniref:cell division protein FtsQ/DivIB n=1 Tax=Wolbachia endosymbiont of Pentidionis agamae TaxID=3110435 RepID=UPI002FD38F81
MLIVSSLLGRIIASIESYLARCDQYIVNLLLSSGFVINKVDVSGNKFTTKKNIINLIDRKKPSIFYLSLTKLAEDIKSENDWIKNVKIYRLLPNSLYIVVEEYELF